jgi:hypothetical protein
MGALSTTPSFSNYTPKSFWKKPESGPGYLLMAGLIGGGLYGLYLALPFLLAIVWGTVNLVIGGLVLALIGYVVLNKTVQTLAKNIFQSICRGIATMYTTIDPIGILKNQLDDAKTEKAQLDATVNRFAGSDENLREAIDKNNKQIQQDMANAASAARKAASQVGNDPTTNLKREQILAEKGNYEEEAGLLMQANKQLQSLEETTANMLDTFRHWSIVADSKIVRMGMRVDLLSKQRKVVLEAKKALSIGQRLLQGDTEQQKMVDAAIDYLAEDAARTVGEIKEFNRTSDRMLTKIDIENGANAELARAQFADFSQKLLASSNAPSAADQLSGVIGGPVPEALPVSRGTSASGGNFNYFDKQ